MLRLLETFGMEDLHAAVQKALKLGAVGFDAVICPYSRTRTLPRQLRCANLTECNRFFGNIQTDVGDTLAHGPSAVPRVLRGVLREDIRRNL